MLPKKVIQKTIGATGDLTGNKINNKITQKDHHKIFQTVEGKSEIARQKDFFQEERQ